jgi:hypothetical protein
MSRKLISGLTIALALLLLAGLWWSMTVWARAADAGQAAAADPTPTGELPSRERTGNPAAPEISFIDNPSATCYLPERHTDACYINWDYFYVTASSSQYIISMTIKIDQQLRAYSSGFFQSAMYIPSDMFSPGFRVACGLPGAGGDPDFGQIYTYTIRARETGGLKAANYGSVKCPSDVVPVADASLTDSGTCFIHQPYSLTVEAAPPAASLPITYTWTVAGQSALTATNGVSNTQTYTWSTPGDKQVAVDIANAFGSATITSTVTCLLAPYTLSLPAIKNQH